MFYAIIYCPQAQGAIIFGCILICSYIYILIVSYFVFSSVLMAVGLNLTNLNAFWLFVSSLVYENSELFNTY